MKNAINTQKVITVFYKITIGYTFLDFYIRKFSKTSFFYVTGCMCVATYFIFGC